MKMKSIFITMIAGLIAFMPPAISYAETNINNVMNRTVHTEDYMFLQEGITEYVHGREFTDTSEDGDVTITYDDLEDNEQLVDDEGNVIINNHVVQPDDITAEQKELLEYFQNMLKNSERGSNYFTPIETDAYGDWFNNMLTMSGSKEEAWMNSMKDNVGYSSGAYILPNTTDVNALYKTYAKNLAITKQQWYDILSKFAKHGSLGFGDNVWQRGGDGIGTIYNLGPNYSGYKSSAPAGYDPDKMISDLKDKYAKTLENMKKTMENSSLTFDLLKLMAFIIPYDRPWWEWIGSFFISIGKSVHATFGGADQYQETSIEKKKKELQEEINKKYNEAEAKQIALINMITNNYDRYTKEAQKLLDQGMEELKISNEAIKTALDNATSEQEKNNALAKHNQYYEQSLDSFNKFYDQLSKEVVEYQQHQAANDFTAMQFETNKKAIKDLDEYGRERGLEPGGPVSSIVWAIEDTDMKEVADSTASLVTGEWIPDVLDNATGVNNHKSLKESWDEYKNAIGTIWYEFANPQQVRVSEGLGLPKKEEATPDALRDKFNQATAEQKQLFDAYDKSTKEAEEAARQAAQARANGDAELEAAWNARMDELNKKAQEALDTLYNSIGYDNFEIPNEYVDLINELYANLDDDHRLQVLSLEKEMLAIANKLKEKHAEFLPKAELEKRMNSLFSNKNVTSFDYNSFLNDYNKVHSKMSDIGKTYAPMAFNYITDRSGWDSYKDYIDRLLFGDQYGLKELGGLNSFYNSGNMALTVVKEKVLRQVTENVTYYGHFNQDFLWRVEDSSGKEVGVYQTDEPGVNLTGGSPDKYHVTENQRADVYLVTARVYGVRYYVFNPVTNTVLASWEEKDMEVTPQPNTASSRWVKVWTFTYKTGKSKSKGVKRNSDLWDTQQIR